MEHVIPVAKITARTGTLWLHEGPDPGEFSFSAEIPLEPFDSGLSYVEQPEDTAISIDSLVLPVTSLAQLDGLAFTPEADEEHGSVYVGGAHNPIEILNIAFKKHGPRRFVVNLRLRVDFSVEGVARPATFGLSCVLDHR